jgi:hypothetical protein
VSQLEQQLKQHQRQLEQQAEIIAQQAATLAELHMSVGKVKEQQRITQGTAGSAVEGVNSLRREVERLSGEAAMTGKLQDDIGRLHSRQQQLAEQQERAECQQAVVLKMPNPLPAGQQAVAAVESFLSQELRLEAKVLRVKQLGKDGGRQGPGNGRAAYKVVLASSRERDAVLRAKADRLRGKPFSINVLLTGQQLANKRALMPAATSAIRAGQRVQWRYDQLLIDGKPHRGAGDVPESRQQQQGDPSSTAPAAPPTVQPPVELEEGEWQSAPSRKAQRKPKGRGPGGQQHGGQQGRDGEQQQQRDLVGAAVKSQEVASSTQGQKVAKQRSNGSGKATGQHKGSSTARAGARNPQPPSGTSRQGGNVQCNGSAPAPSSPPTKQGGTAQHSGATRAGASSAASPTSPTRA